MIRKRLLATTGLVIGVASSASFISNYAAAQTSPSSGAQAASAPISATPDQSGGEVVVTARARSEKLLEVPISVQSFSASQLSANNITDLNTLQYAAGFVFNSQGASYSGGGREFPTLIFRGMSSNYGGAFGGSSGALFVDGIYISGGLASVTLADASQVEVLKGPQNVYFGKNTFGGAINLITSNPSEEYHASATAGYSYKGSYDDVATVEGAILPGLLTGRVSGELFHQGAQYKAEDAPQAGWSGSGRALGEEDTKAITVVLYATPTSDTWLRARVHYSHDNDSSAADGFVTGTSTCAGLINPYFCGNLPTYSHPASVLTGTGIPDNLLNAIATNNYGGGASQLWGNKVPKIDHSGLERDNLQGSLAGGAKLPYDSTFQFNVGYNQAAADDLEQADHTPYVESGGTNGASGTPVTFSNFFLLPSFINNPKFITNTDTIDRDFQADARVVSSPNQPLRAVFGLSYFQSINQLSQSDAFSAWYTGNFAGLAPSAATPINASDKTEAAYGSLDYDIVHDLTVTGELRYQRDTVADIVGTTNLSKVYSHGLPRVLLKYHPDSDTNYYVSYSEGVQPPQLQYAYVGATGFEKAALQSYGVGSPYTGDPTVHVWEIGYKKSLFSRRIFFSVDYYDEQWNGALVNTFIFDPGACKLTFGATYSANSSATCALGSSGQSITGTSNDHIRGVEFEGTARITQKLTGHLAFNWTDAIRRDYYDSSWGQAFTSGVVPSQNGKRVDLVPEWQGTADLTYKDHLVGPYDWYAHGVVNYTGDQYIEATDIAKISAYTRVNLFAGITRGNLKFEAFVTNLFDDKNWDMGVRFPNPQVNSNNGDSFGFGEAYQGAIVTAPNPRDFGFRISDKF